jgi:hypothetical protein
MPTFFKTLWSSKRPLKEMAQSEIRLPIPTNEFALKETRVSMSMQIKMFWIIGSPN